jgi:acetylornithine deacetylase/succinyl-diaminopimelate desuccinylase-like protein
MSAGEPNFTDPANELVVRTLANARARCGARVASNIRVGMSDARFYRALGIPSVCYGPTPYNMGGPDEYVTDEDLEAVLFVHAMTAYDFLRGTP